MSRRLRRISALLDLARIGLVLTAVADAWTIVFLSRAIPGMPSPAPLKELPLGVVLACTAGLAGGLYVFGMALNDVMDARRDRTFAPDRPIPSRRVTAGAAVGLAIASLLVAAAATVPLGPVSLFVFLATAGLILFYDAMAKHVAGLGVLVLGLVRAGHMLTVNPLLGYTWPVWLTMSHVIGLSTLGHRLEGKRPRLEGGHTATVIGGWAVASVALLGWAGQRDWLTIPGEPWIWAGPTAAAAVFVAMAVVTVRSRPAKQAGMTVIKRGLLWLIIYDASWLLSAGMRVEAAIIAGCIPATFLIMQATRHLRSIAEGMPGFSAGPGVSASRERRRRR